MKACSLSAQNVLLCHFLVAGTESSKNTNSKRTTLVASIVILLFVLSVVYKNILQASETKGNLKNHTGTKYKSKERGKNNSQNL